MPDTNHFIAGRWLAGEGAEFSAIDPTTGAPSWQGRAATSGEVDAAVSAARQTFEAWSDVPVKKRIELVESMVPVLKKHEKALAEAISVSTGKPRWETTNEVTGLTNKIAVSIEAYGDRCGEEVRDIGGAKAYTRYKPQGVIGILGPFNMPAHLPHGQIVPALIAGNTVVFKPSEQTPLVGQRMVEMWRETKLPAGAIHLVQGGRDTGAALAQHRGIDGLLFTGSHAAGLALSKAFAETPERILALEMGGNNPLIVDRVKDLKAAAYFTIQSAYITAGQRCTCARRLIVVESSDTKRYLDELLAMIGKLRVGKWNDEPQPFMGPVISKAAAQKVLAAQAELIARGAIALKACGGASGDSGGAMVTPGLIDVTSVKDRADVEVFGPLLQLIRVKDFDEAIRVANDTRYGLAAGLLCEDRAKYEKFCKRIRAGVIQWNRQTTGASGQLPFGGVGRSGNHRPAGYFVADACSYAHAVYESEAVTMPQSLAPGGERLMQAYEVNFDGLIGPTHNYAGLSYGNVASMSQKGAASSPKQAALQGLAKMKLLAELGVKQAVLPPQERPDVGFLRRMGFDEKDEGAIVGRAFRDAPLLLASAYSASSMWAANAATVSPSADTTDGLVHLTAANLLSQLHRSIEAERTSRLLKRVFGDESWFVSHAPLPASPHVADEGAANHTRLCAAHGEPGFEIFTFGRTAFDAGGSLPTRFPARQAREASEAIARRHALRTEDTFLIQQNPEAIDAGVFHNDVVVVGNQDVFLCHEKAYVDTFGVLRGVGERFGVRCGKPLTTVVVREDEVPLKDAVASYLFNSQVVTLPDGSMTMIYPVECDEHESTRRFLDALLTRGTPIKSKHVVDLRQSMRNGGGPACLRLRVMLTEEELKHVHQGVMWTPALHEKLVAWVNKHYRDELKPDDLRDVRLIAEGRDALDELARILDLPGLYQFQQ